jgi:hypothetical protein
MKMDGPDELAAILDDICATIGELLVTNAQLKESMVDDAATDAAKEKLDRLKQDTLAAKGKLADIKQRQQRKHELEKIRKDHERERTTEGKNSGMVTLRAANGRCIGYMRVMGKEQTDFFSASGKLVAREVGNVTYANGKAVFRGRLGLVVLGKALAA